MPPALACFVKETKVWLPLALLQGSGVQLEAVWAVQIGLPSGSWAWGSVAVRLPDPSGDHTFRASAGLLLSF